MARRAVVLALLTAAPFSEARLSAQAGPPALPTTVTLDQVLKLLDERSPRTAAIRSSVPVVAADRITAQTLPNPTLSYGGVHLLSGLSTGAVTQHQVVVEQPLLLFHKRQARLDAADANVKAEEAHVTEALAEPSPRSSRVRRNWPSCRTA
jgi:outer membrane protein TolC